MPAEKTERNSRKQLVACVGNMLLLDEGFGPYMAQVLTDRDKALEHFDEEHADLLVSTFRPDETEPPEGDERIPVLDAGTMGMGMIPYIRDYDQIIVVDAVDCGPDAKPGTCYVFTPEEMAENSIMHSLHDMRVPDVLNNARLAGYDCDIMCVGVQVKDMNPRELTVGLTPEVSAAVPYAVAGILDQLGLEI
ncbi:MAG: hydrogenase maturation protease [Coriobacteriales bacterium]|jgi:hydrogenase maturation protease